MRKILLLLLLAVPLTAQTFPVIQFDPPDPTSRTGVYAHVHIPGFACGIDHWEVARDRSTITITLFPRLNVECVRAATVDFTADLGVLPAGVYLVKCSPITVVAGLVVRDGTPPFEVRPNTRGSGTDLITLFGPHVLDGATSVHFGTTAAEIVSAGPDIIVVKEPGFAPGVFDVTVEKPDGTLTATAAYHVPTPNALFASPAFYENVLLPVYWSGPGAYGAQWLTTASLYNGNGYPLTAAFFTVLKQSCPVMCDTRPQAATMTITNADASHTAGIVEQLPRQAMAHVDLTLNIRDTSRAAQDLGTEIPVVRESQFYARPFSITNVPSDPRYRATLRLYNLGWGAVFDMRVFPRDGAQLLATQMITLNPDAGLDNGGFAMISDLLASYPQLAGMGPLRIEIDPFIRNGIKSAWGFVTVTNNDTQHVTVISAQ